MLAQIQGPNAGLLHLPQPFTLLLVPAESVLDLEVVQHPGAGAQLLSEAGNPSKIKNKKMITTIVLNM